MSKRRRYGADSLDRISNLPDRILSYILSFLPTKDALATHILSKSWRFVWTSITNLEFSYIGYKHAEDLFFPFSDFVNFVNYVMLLHKPAAAYLNRLSLTLSNCELIEVVDAWINAWICSAVSKNVHELFVSCKTYKPPIHVYTCMFTSEWLQSLELKCDICISSEVTIFSIDSKNEEAFRELLDGCHVLKYLFVDASMDRNSKSVISSSSLRHLELCLSYKNKAIYGSMTPCAINLDAPSLEYIKLQGVAGYVTFVQGSFTSLEDAYIRPYLLRHAFHSAVEAVQAFDCARVLTLSATIMEGLRSTNIQLRTKFRRLTRLEVIQDWNHWSVLQELVSLSDSLEVLTIYKGIHSKREDCLTNSSWKIPNLVPICLSNSLKTVTINSYYGHADELAIVAYTLKHGRVLQLMQISFDVLIKDFQTKFEMVQEISKFPSCHFVKLNFVRNKHIMKCP